MVRRFLLLVAVVAAIAAAAAAIFGRRRGPEANGCERTEELRREIEAARARLRESIRAQEG
jgi:hypothetical protein